MKKFLVLYRSETSARAQMADATPEQAKAGMEEWMGWAKKNGDAIKDMGSPLGRSVELTPTGKSSGDEEIAGYSIVEGDSLEEVSKRFTGHPHFHTPGKSAIQIVEFLPVPGM